MEVNDDVASHRAALRTQRFEQRGGDRQVQPDAAPANPHQIRVDLPDHVNREKPPQAGVGESGIGAAEQAGWLIGVDVLELRAHLNWKLARSAPNSGFQTTLPRSIASETIIEAVGLPIGTQGASFM